MNKIPKIIHYCWLSNDPFPELISQCIASWKKFLPDYEFMLWDTNRFDLETSIWAKEAYSAKKYAFAADYIRIYSIYKFGGIYLDTDVEVLKSLNPFLHHSAFTGFENKTEIEAAIIGAEKGHPWLKDILDYYDGRRFIREDGSYDQKILPVIMSLITVDKYGFQLDGQKQVLKNDIHIYPEDYFSPKNIRTLKIHKTKNSVTIHHFNAGWIKKGFTYKFKRFLHHLLMLTGESFHLKIVKFLRKFTGNSEL
ncbi:MAG: glycosyl transferase [Candidatus Delongbacteria bacterium]|nr:glycosyl transferase [Candidatus Delongbacteria bacterium]